MCIVYLVAFLFGLTAEQCSSELIEDSSQSFMERMNTGKTSFIYFGNNGETLLHVLQMIAEPFSSFTDLSKSHSSAHKRQKQCYRSFLNFQSPFGHYISFVFTCSQSNHRTVYGAARDVS